LRQFQPARVLQVQAHALLVAVVHRKVARAGAEQLPGRVAADRLDLDHLRAELDEDGADRWPHDHVRELDDANPAQRCRDRRTGALARIHGAASVAEAG